MDSNVVPGVVVDQGRQSRPICVREPAAQHVVRVLVDLGVVGIVARVVDAIRPISVDDGVTFLPKLGDAVLKSGAVLWMIVFDFGCMCVCAC